MEVTDNHIKLLKASAQLTAAIKLATEGIAEMAEFEAQCRTKRLEMEATLGQLVAQKMMLDLYPPV